MNKYVSLTRDLIEESGYKVEFDQDGTPHVISYKKKEPVEMRFSTRMGKQKYSTNNRVYLYVQLSLKGRRDQAYALSRVVWAWCHGECPVDMTVDHIDNNHSTQYDNRLENLQLLSHADNLAKRYSPRNQWSFMLTTDEMDNYRMMKGDIFVLRSQIEFWERELKAFQPMYTSLRDIISSIKDDPGAFLSGLHWEDGHASWEGEGLFPWEDWDIAPDICSWAEDAVASGDYSTRNLLDRLKVRLLDYRAMVLDCKNKLRDYRARLSKARKEMDSYVRDIREEYYRKNS